MDNLFVATRCLDLGDRFGNCVGGTGSLRLYLGVTGSPLVGYVT
jgi:hypothetical protein